MTLTDSFLQNVAKAIANESFDTISHFSFGETVATAIDPTTVILAGEVGSRLATTTSRTGATATFTGTRSGASVVDTANGDDIRTFGTNSASTGSNLQGGVIVAGVTHTTNFDIDCTVSVEVKR